MEKLIETVDWENWIKKKSNLVIIVMDSVRYDQFDKADTPNIDKLFIYKNKAYSSASWTLPSMKAILHGMFPQGRRQQDRIFPNFRPWQKPMPNILKKRGYYTYAYSANPLFCKGSMGEMIFDKFWYDSERNLEGSGERLVEHFLNDIKNIIKEPFFAIFLFIESHAPFKYLGRNYSKKLTKKELQREGIIHLDKLFKQIYDVLPINTEVYITADHGELFRDDEYGYEGHNPQSGAVGFSKLFEVFAVKIIK